MMQMSHLEKALDSNSVVSIKVNTRVVSVDSIHAGAGTLTIRLVNNANTSFSYDENGVLVNSTYPCSGFYPYESIYRVIAGDTVMDFPLAYPEVYDDLQAKENELQLLIEGIEEKHNLSATLKAIQDEVAPLVEAFEVYKQKLEYAFLSKK